MSATALRAKGPSRRRPSRAVIWIALFATAALWVGPFVFMLFTSLKSPGDIFETPAFAPPTNPAFENYVQAIEQGELLGSFWNSTIIALIKVPLGLLVSALAAFAIARLRVPWRRTLLAVIVLGAMIPVQVVLLPLFRIVLSLGLLNKHLGVILPYIAFGVPYQVFILYGFFRAIPRELDEAARIDGASNLQVFRRIILPLAAPALAALFIIDFVATWNEFPMALVILQHQESWTVPLALQSFNTQFTASYGPLNSTIVMGMLPVLVVYLLFQRYFIETFSGAIKG
jgi:raffinose/stachyose/melibiose transport system permease protein